jgi:hypothetical protein
VSLENYLRQMTQIRGTPTPPFKYNTFEHFVLEQGAPAVSQPFPAGRKTEILTAIRRRRLRFPIKQCFGNSLEFLLATMLPGVVYVEGYATGVIMPVHHAWVTVDGAVLDLTMRLHWPHAPGRKRDSIRTNRIWGDLQGREYYGVAFPDRAFHVKRALATGLFSSVIDDWPNNWPALRGEYD